MPPASAADGLCGPTPASDGGSNTGSKPANAAKSAEPGHHPEEFGCITGNQRQRGAKWHCGQCPDRSAGPMNNDLILTLIFAAVAAFVLYKLRSVLGRREGHEQQPPDFFAEAERNAANDSAAKEGAGNDTALPAPGPAGRDAADADPESPAAAGIRDIRAADRTFDPDAFLEGARAAFDTIVEAFARGDRDALAPLLAENVFANFESAIAERERAGETLETTIVALNSAELTAAEMQGRAARVTVTFVSEQSNTVKDADGNLVDGDPAAVEKITDIWTFARDTRSRDPNWQLVETDGG